VRTFASLLVLAMLAGPAYGQTPGSFTCGNFKAESTRTGASSRWTITRGSEKSTESGVLKNGPHFECIAGEVLAVEFTPTAGMSFVGLYFPDGSDIGYGGQILRRNNRFVLPIQARTRVEARFRAAFDYHCRLEMPADPIAPTSRADCISVK
jgi:hypothetical protein